MNLSDWRSQQRETITLPSGLEVTLRRVGFIDLLANGDIPVTLMSEIDALRKGPMDVTFDEVPKYAEAINVVVLASVADPPVAETADDTHLGVKELSFDDRVEIFKWANQGAAQYKKFRAQPPGDVAAVQPGDGVSQAAE